MSVVPPDLGPRAARAKSIWPVTLTGVLVHEADEFSHPLPFTASNRAAIPAVVELGRSNDGPPTLVVMQPGLRVVPPGGLASKDWMVRLLVALDECSGVKNWVPVEGGAGDSPPRPA